MKPMKEQRTAQRKTSRASELVEVGTSTRKMTGRRQPPKASNASTAASFSRMGERSRPSEDQTVYFELFDPAARQVFLAGTFNDWDPSATSLKNEGGKWTLQLLLKPGRYEYRFVVDGRWLEDSAASRFAGNPFGGLNSVVEVKPSSQIGDVES